MSYIHAKGKNGYIGVNANPFLKIPSGSFATTGTFLISAATNTPTDVGGNAVSISKTGTVNSSATIPFASSTYKSMSFGGSGNWLAATNSVVSPGTGDFTVECWFRLTSIVATSVIVELSPNGASGARSNGLLCWVTTGGAFNIFQAGIFYLQAPTNTILTNTWYHVAFTRLNGLFTMWLNGSQFFTTNAFSVTNFNSGGMLIAKTCDGSSSASNCINGFVSNYRITKGLAMYKDPFTPSTVDLNVTTEGFNWSTNYGVQKL